jgi:thiol:disulfide interchange protein DsbA
MASASQLPLLPGGTTNICVLRSIQLHEEPMLNALTRRAFLFGMAALAAVSVYASDPVAGQDYNLLPNPQPVANPAKGEVIEFFWYGCSHCYHYEPYVEAWAKTVPKDAVFRREHVLFPGRSDMEGHVRLFLALKMLGKQDVMAPKVFDAIHKDGVELRDPKTLFDWIGKQGINLQQFQGAYNAFSMRAEMQHAEQMVSSYNISGVPMFVVDGKYIVSAQQGDEEGKKMFATINALLAKDRKGKK